MKYSPQSLWYIYACQNPTVFIRSCFSLGIPMQLLCCSLLGEKINPPAREGKSPAYLFPVSSSGGWGIAGGAAVCRLLVMLPVSVARGQPGCPLARGLQDGSDAMCSPRSRARELARSSAGARSQARARLPWIQQAACSRLSVRAPGLLWAAPARTAWMKLR